MASHVNTDATLDEREKLYCEIQDIIRASAASHGHSKKFVDCSTPKLEKQSSSLSNMPKIETETFYERI